MLNRLTNLFPLWAIAASLAAYFFPQAWQPLKPAIIPLLGIVMLGMGLTLTVNDFYYVLKRPKLLVIGVALQYTIMPLMAFAISRLAGLPQELLIGMVLVGCAPGGTASNVICFLARADVALSISLTLLSTLISFMATPFLTWVYIGQTVDVAAWSMLVTILKIIIVPVVFGVTINTLWGKRLIVLKHAFPLISVMAIVIIIAIIVALNKDNVASAGWLVGVCVMAHNLLGLSAGYGIARLVKCDKRQARTIAIEVGMQNSGLSVALALKHFSHLSALPGAIFSIWHNLSGAFLARYWSKKN